MKATRKLHDLGQSLWLDNITRDLLDERHARALHRRAVGDRAHVESDDLRSGDQGQLRLRRRDPQQARRRQVGRGAVLRAGAGGHHAARPTCSGRSTSARAASTAGSRSRCRRCSRYDTQDHARGRQASCMRGPGGRNLFIKIPGTKEGLPAIEEAIFAGVPINVTLLFSREHYLAAAEAYLRGIERRIAAGLNPDVASVASVFISRWDVAVAGKVPAALANTLGIAIGQRSLQGVLRPARVAALAARDERRRRGRSGCCSRAPAPRIRRRPTSSTSRRWRRRSPSTRCPRTRCKAFADHGEVGATDARRRRRLRGGAARSSRRPAWTSTRSRRSCRTRAPSRSSSRGTS